MTILFAYLFWQSLVCYVIPDVITLLHCNYCTVFSCEIAVVSWYEGSNVPSHSHQSVGEEGREFTEWFPWLAPGRHPSIQKFWHHSLRRSNINWPIDIHWDKPVGFYGPCAPPVPNANSSEYPQFGMPAELRSLNAGAARRLLLQDGAALRFQQPHTIRSARGCRNDKFQNLSPPSVLFERSRFFYNTQET